MSEQPLGAEKPQETLSNVKKPGFDYVQYVESLDFGEYEKYALDLAKLLNHEYLTIEGDVYEMKRRAGMKIDVFNHFCAACVKAGVEVPPLDSDLYLPFVPETDDSTEAQDKVKKVTKIREFVESQIGETIDPELKDKLTVMVKFLTIFASEFDEVSSFGGISTIEILALLNKTLVEAGLNPVRPDYTKFDHKNSIKESGPAEQTNLLVVDDDFSEIIKSVLRVAGWPNINIDFHLFQRDYSDKSAKEQKVAKLAEEILARSPKVILMDQGIDGDFEGSDVISAMNENPRAEGIRYVANTGGNDEKLRMVGAYHNFEKGRSLTGLRKALSVEK